jgi:hypothetical protein
MTYYRIFCKPDGDEHYYPTDEIFQSRKEADNFAYIETIAGMGEDYKVVEIDDYEAVCVKLCEV